MKKTKNEGGNESEEEVAGGAGGSDDKGVTAFIFKVVGVKLNWLAPAKMEKDEGNGAEGVEMF